MRLRVPIVVAFVALAGCAGSIQSTSGGFVSDNLEKVESISTFSRGNETPLDPGSPEFDAAARDLLAVLASVDGVERTLTPKEWLPALVENSTGWRMRTSEPLAPPRHPDAAVQEFIFVVAAPGSFAEDGSVLLCGEMACGHYRAEERPQTYRGTDSG